MSSMLWSCTALVLTTLRCPCLSRPQMACNPQVPCYGTLSRHHSFFGVLYRWDDDRRWPTFDVCVTTNPFSIRMLSDQHFVISLRNCIMQRVFIIRGSVSCVLAIAIPVNSSYTTLASSKCGSSVCIIFNAYFSYRKHARQ